MKLLTMRLLRRAPALLVAITLGLASPLICVLQCQLDGHRAAPAAQAFLCPAGETHVPPAPHPALKALYELLPASAPALAPPLLAAAMVYVAAAGYLGFSVAPPLPPPRGARVI